MGLPGPAAIPTIAGSSAGKAGPGTAGETGTALVDADRNHSTDEGWEHSQRRALSAGLEAPR